MIRKKSTEYHCKGSLIHMGMGVILLKWWAIYFLNRWIVQVTVTHSYQHTYMMIRYVLRYSSGSTPSVILIVKVWLFSKHLTHHATEYEITFLFNICWFFICAFWWAKHFQLMQPNSIAVHRDKTWVIRFVNI